MTMARLLPAPRRPKKRSLLAVCTTVLTSKKGGNLFYFKTKLKINLQNIKLAFYGAVLTINAPVNLTAPCIIFSGGFFSLRGRLSP